MHLPFNRHHTLGHLLFVLGPFMFWGMMTGFLFLESHWAGTGLGVTVASLLTGAGLLGAAKGSLFVRGRWVSWGSAGMPTWARMLYRYSYFLMVFGLAGLLASVAWLSM